VRAAWESVALELRNHLDRITLAKLAERNEVPMFYI
jgi:DNA-binding IscR family transcriptional regulator